MRRRRFALKQAEAGNIDHTIGACVKAGAGALSRKRSKLMCDYSLHAVASRPAKVGETLITTTFRGTSTRGFAAEAEPEVAVCLLPGTELAFENDVLYEQNWFWKKRAGCKVARFREVEPDVPHRHHDALEFPDGRRVLTTLLCKGQRATVLQLPVAAGEASAVVHADQLLARINRSVPASTV
jgi:hypothetical protein